MQALYLINIKCTHREQ